MQLLRGSGPQGQGQEDHQVHLPRRVEAAEGAAEPGGQDRPVSDHEVPMRQLRGPPGRRQGQGQER